MKVLYYSVWYPSPKDEMAGLFVKKHKEAVEGVAKASGEEVEIRVNTFWPQADIIQLNVLSLKYGLLALLQHILLGTPYIIIEHWTQYLPENGMYEKRPRWYKILTELIARHAEVIYPVSRPLEENMKRCGIIAKKWGRMNNVVDDFFYQKKVSSVHTPFRFLHVSCFDEEHKNVKGILRCCHRLVEQRKDFTLTLVGVGPDWEEVYTYAQELKFPKGLLRWTGELMPSDVCEEMLDADCFVFFSRYENAPVVLSECMAIGLPIISSKVGFVPDLSTNCGIWVDSEDENALYNAMLHIINHPNSIDRELLRHEGQQYSYERVGNQLKEIYETYCRS